MQEPPRQTTIFQDLVPDLLVLIIIQTGDPIHFGRLLQLNKAIKEKFKDPAKTKNLWQFFLHKEFPKFQPPKDNPDFQKLYRQESKLKTTKTPLEAKYRRLYHLIEIGDLTSLQKVKSLPDISNEGFFYTEEGRGAILTAKQYNQQAVLNFFYDLVEKTVFSKKDRDKYNGTLLHFASAFNIISSINGLIKLNESADPVDKKNVTPLCLAAACGNVEVANQLLASGAKIDHASFSGRTPLHFAAHYGHDDMVAVLLAAGGNINQRDKKGETPLHNAARQGKTTVVRHLLSSSANVDPVAYNGGTPLFLAAQQGHADVVQLLKDAGADINYSLPNGATPIFIAAQQGNYDVVTTLLAAKANILQTNHDPVYIAAQNNHLDVLVALATAGASIDEGIYTGYTPLYIATLKGHEKIVRALLKMGVRVNTIAINGRTALNIAQGQILTLLKLWEKHELQKDFGLFSEVVTILKMPLTDFFTQALNSVTAFFSATVEDPQIEEIFQGLGRLSFETKDGTLKEKYKQFLESKRSLIPAIKYEFIMEVSLASDEPMQPEATNTKGFK